MTSFHNCQQDEMWMKYGGGIPASTEADPTPPPPPPVNRMTNRCKNITLATTSLRPVIIAINNLSWKLLLLWELLARTTGVATRDHDAGWFLRDEDSRSQVQPTQLQSGHFRSLNPIFCVFPMQ